MKAVTFETLIADQQDRIERNAAKEGTNLILDYINDINNELIENQL